MTAIVEHYKRTFWATQAVIALATGWAYFTCHRMWFAAAMVFLMMQIGAVVGAVWATRLRRRLQQRI